MGKLKICNLLRVTTYLELVTASIILSWSVYHAYQYQTFSPDQFLWGALVMGSAIQIVFSIGIMRMMHYYVPEQKALNKIYLLFFQAVTILTSLVSAASVWLFFYLLKESCWQNDALQFPNHEQWMILSLLGSYTVVSIYTIAGSAKLKKAILQNQLADTESWLDEMESSVMA